MLSTFLEGDDPIPIKFGPKGTHLQ